MLLQNADSFPNTNFFRNFTKNKYRGITQDSLSLDSRRITSKIRAPGSSKKIKESCTLNYGVIFPMMWNISVSGNDQAPMNKCLTQKSDNGKIDQEVTWNFQKFLINEKETWWMWWCLKEIPKAKSFWIGLQKTNALFCKLILWVILREKQRGYRSLWISRRKCVSR